MSPQKRRRPIQHLHSQYGFATFAFLFPLTTIDLVQLAKCQEVEPDSTFTDLEAESEMTTQATTTTAVSWQATTTAVSSQAATTTGVSCYTEVDPDSVRVDDHNTCQKVMFFGKTNGIVNNPEWYTGSNLTAQSSWNEWQTYVSSQPNSACLPPCWQANCCKRYRIDNVPSIHNSRSGVFSEVLVSDAYPVYQNADGQYLYYWQPISDWLVGSNFASDVGGLQSSNDQNGCPETFSSWMYDLNSQWNPHAISVVCEAADEEVFILIGDGWCRPSGCDVASVECRVNGYYKDYSNATECLSHCGAEATCIGYGIKLPSPARCFIYTSISNAPSNGWYSYVKSYHFIGASSGKSDVQCFKKATARCYTEDVPDLDDLGSINEQTECQIALRFAKTIGIKNHPDWYAGSGLTALSSWFDWQMYMSNQQNPQGCLRPCTTTATTTSTTTASVTYTADSFGNVVIEEAYGVGAWGGRCECPDGQIYWVGDLNEACESLACFGGISGTCNKMLGKWRHRKVICQAPQNMTTMMTTSDATTRIVTTTKTTTSITMVDNTIIFTISFPSLINFEDVNDLVAAFKAAVANATGSSHADTIVDIESIALVVQLAISDPPSESIIQEALAEHAGVPGSAVAITTVDRRLRQRRLRDTSFSGEIDASADLGSTDVVQAAKHMQLQLQDQETLESIISQKAGRNVALSSSTSFAKIKTRSFITTPSSATDLESMNVFSVIGQSLGGTISQQSSLDGVILPPSTSTTVVASVVTTFSAALTAIGSDSGEEEKEEKDEEEDEGEEEGNSFTLVVLILGIVGGLIFLAVLGRVLFKRISRCRWRIHFQEDSNRLRALESRLATDGAYLDKVKGLAVGRNSRTLSPLALDTKLLKEEVDMLKKELPRKLERSVLESKKARLESLSVALENEKANNKTAQLAETNKMRKTLKDGLEFEDILSSKMEQLDELVEKIQIMKAAQKAAEDGVSCSFWCVHAERIRDCEEVTLPCFQELQLRDPKWLVLRPITFAESCRTKWLKNTLVISHRWEHPEYPDKGGVQLHAIRQHLIRHPEFEYVWYDFWCMPQGEKTDEHKREFQLMLKNVNMLYLAASVLLLVDMSYMSRFWTQFEAWLSLQKATLDGLVGAEANERRCTITCLHNAHTSFRWVLVEMWGGKSAAEAKAVLELPDVTVTNQDDKVTQLTKVAGFDEAVKKSMKETQKYLESDGSTNSDRIGDVQDAPVVPEAAFTQGAPVSTSVSLPESNALDEPREVSITLATSVSQKGSKSIPVTQGATVSTSASLPESNALDEPRDVSITLAASVSQTESKGSAVVLPQRFSL